MMLSIFSLAGRFHPVLVHLPIGILLLALLLEFIAARPEKAGWKEAADLALGLGVLSAGLSCVTGYLLSQTGDYDAGVVGVHQWLAISTTVLAGLLYALIKGRRLDKISGVLIVFVLILLTLTGHWGGTLTHGEGYLTAAVEEKTFSPELRPVADIEHAVLYTSMVEPVLHDNCYRCHSAGRVKGGLRLDSKDWLMKGGKDGPVIVAGHADASELIKRVLLPLEDEHHMAPKDKAQLTKDELHILQWWINTGASFDKTAGSLEQDSATKLVLGHFQKGTAGPVGAQMDEVVNVADSDMPVSPVNAASAEVVQKLEAAGALVLPTSQNSHYLTVSMEAGARWKDIVELLPKLKDQLVCLKCSFVKLDDSAMPEIGNCTNLVRLWLDHTGITGKGLDNLRGLDHLRYLNLTETGVDDGALRVLQSLPSLRSLYIYHTRVDRKNWTVLQAGFPRAKLDSGGYGLDFLPTDTAIVRAPAPRK